MTIKSYSLLSQLETFEERYEYLMIGGKPGHETFGFDRHINQSFYRSRAWIHARRDVISRDMGCDLGIPGREIHHGLLIHHMNPMTVQDIIRHEDWIIDPEYLITTNLETHNAIHYGDKSFIQDPWVERTPGDTKLWGN